MTQRYRIKIADLEDNFIYMNVRGSREEVDALIHMIQHRTNCAARYERLLAVSNKAPSQ